MVSSRSRHLFFLAAAFSVLAGAFPAPAQVDPLVTGKLQIQGSRLTIYADPAAQLTDADQTINVGEQAQVRTCFGGAGVPCGSVRPGDPRAAGLKVLAELSGPELPQAVPLETVPGGTFLLPGFQQEGEYYLENIRLVNDATGEALSFASPSVAILHVRQIVLAEASVRTLTLEEMRARGITFTEENFQAYDFAVGFAIGSEVVQIRFPIVYTGDGQALPLGKPQVQLDGLPPDVVATVARWKPPHVVPFKLDKKPDGEGLDIGAEEDEELVLPVFGAIVIPGTVTYLNQFFDASLIVANGADAGSNVKLENLRGKIRLPGGNVLRLAQSSPAVSPGQAVPVLASHGGAVLFPKDQGQATWTLEGLRAGTHVVVMDLEGEITRPGREELPVYSRVQAAVEVVDARFNVTFSHPDVVREGEAYTLFVTVSNQSQVAQNLITVKIRAESMTGAHKANVNDPLERQIATLGPGQSQTVEFDLVSELTGKVMATTFQSDNQNLIGTIQLRTGVGELGIPLSPATLLMPRYTEFLQPPYTHSAELVKAHVRLFGLAYSLAVAPAAMVPPGLPALVKDDVERRAIDLAEAGQRLYLQDQLLSSLEVLALDQLGNRHPLAGFDEIRRRTDKGLRAAAQISAFWRREQGSAANPLDGEEFFDHFAATTSYSRPFLAALSLPEGSGGLPRLEIVDTQGVLGGIAEDEANADRSLPWGEVYAVRRDAGSDEVLAPFAVVGRVAPTALYKLRLINSEPVPASTRLILMVPDGATGVFRKVIFSMVTVPGNSTLELECGPGTADGAFQLRDDGSHLPVGGAAHASDIPLPPFRIVGSHQETRLDEKGPDTFGNYYRPNRHGNGMTYLFNRPPVKEEAERAAAWKILTTYSGLTDAEQPASGSATKTGLSAWVQPNSERVVNVRYDGLIGAQIDASTQSPLVQHQHQIAASTVHDLFGQALQAAVPPPVIERIPLHTGGLVGGRVVRGTGEGVAGAKVELIRPRVFFTALDEVIKNDLIATTTTDANGRYFFEYIEEPHWDFQVELVGTFVLRATVPEGDDPELEPAEAAEITARLRRQNRLATINIALLGRGAVQGKLLYLDTQLPVPKGRVIAASTLFSEQKSVRIAADGTFRIPGLPVGPITLTGSDEEGRRVYATVGIERPGATVDVTLELQRQQPNTGAGTVRGKVLRQRSGETPAPAADARIAVYADGHPIAAGRTEDDGSFLFERVPAGRVTLQAADWRVSRASAVADLLLADGATVYQELKLVDGGTRTVVGQVLFRDPITSTLMPVQGAVAFVQGPGNFAYTDATGTYRIENLPVPAAEERYDVTVIDFQRQFEGRVEVPPITEASPEVIDLQPVIIQSMRGRVEGVVLDPLGRPAGNVAVVLYPLAEGTTAGDGSFVFEDVPLGGYEVVAHQGDGLQSGKVGYFGSAKTQVVYGGHAPFVSVRMVGAGIVRIKTRTATSTGILTPIYYKPTYYSTAAKNIVLKGAYIETSTDPNGFLELRLPVGGFELVAYNPFHGIKNISDEISYAGQILDFDVLFEDAGKVRGVVVDVDGVTPVPDVEVTLKTRAFLPQTLRSGPLGEFTFELVPQGTVEVEARGYVGNVPRVGKTFTLVTLGGQDVEVVVQMKAQGSVRGRVMELYNGALRPLPFAQYYVTENSFPFRRIPDEGTFRTADASGNYEVSGLYAGRVEVVARDSTQTTRRGKAFATIVDDWSLVTAPDIVMETSVGTLRVLMRDPATGAGVPDAMVRLGGATWSVTGADGVAVFESLALGTYDIYAFNAPTGQSGRLAGVRLLSAGEIREATVYLDVRGEVDGYLLDTAVPRVPVAGGTVALRGFSAGGNISALATSSGRPDQLGYFLFGGIPEGEYSLAASAPGSVRRGSAVVGLTETAPKQTIEIVLEPVEDAHFRLFEKLRAGDSPVDTGLGVFSLRLTQPSSVPYQLAYDFTLLDPDAATGTYFFRDLLAQRPLNLSAREGGGEQRKRDHGLSSLASAATALGGAGTAGDPYQVVLGAKGAVQITVRDAANQPVPRASITLATSDGSVPLVAGDNGVVVWNAISAGNVTATARHPTTGTAGRADGVITYDDDVIYLLVQLAPSVSAQGVIYEPVPGDVWDGVTPLAPKDGAIVEFRDGANALQIRVTGADGAYRFDALTAGTYSILARNNNLDQVASRSGTLSLPNGTLNQIPALILDAAPPRIVQITPAPGLENVSRLAQVEILFSEPLLPAALPPAGGNGNFRLRAPGGQAPAGSWSSELLASGQQAVRFTPSAPYQNLTVYGLTISGTGVRDRMSRPLSTTGDVGANFKTSDSVGPAVLATDPRLDRPLRPATSVRIDFNEKVVLPPEGIEAVATWEVEAGGSWFPVPISAILTRNDYSLLVTPLSGFAVPGASLKRRLTVDLLRDVTGNPMSAPYVANFRLWDENDPTLAIDPPPGVVNGELYTGARYTVTPAIGNLDDLPAGDLEKVEYFLSDPASPTVPASPSFVATAPPWSFTFTGAYQGNGSTPRPFPIWVRATDTSTNPSNVAFLDLEVLPNAAPSLAEVAVEAIAPVPGAFYAGSKVRATLVGIDDADGNQLTPRAELLLASGALVQTLSGSVLSKPAGGWPALPPVVFEFILPKDWAEGTELKIRGSVRDSQNITASADSSTYPVADDQNPSQITSFAAQKSGVAALVFYIGDKVRFEVRAKDLETAVKKVSIEIDRGDVFPALVATTANAAATVFTTAELPVLPDLFDERTPIEATAVVEDYGGNVSRQPLVFEVAPAADPTAPQATWLTPWQNGEWPALHASVLARSFTPLLLRATVTDTSLTEQGELVPGNIVSVTFRGPVQSEDGEVRLAETWTAAVRVDAGGPASAGLYQLIWPMPNGLPEGASLPFAIRAVDSGGRDSVSVVSLTAVQARRVYEGAQTSVAAADEMLLPEGDPDGPVFVLDGTLMSIEPRPTPLPVRRLGALYVYGGGRIEANGATTVFPSRLVAAEITTLDSVIKFKPLELQIDRALGIGHGSALDVSGRGLLGGTLDRQMLLPGQVGSAVLAGGSHGGLGWAFTGAAGETFDSLQNPYLPGGGGRSNVNYNNDPLSSNGGGAGGGVVSLFMPEGVLHLAGDLLARGAAPRSGVQGGGGGGGAVDLAVARIDGRGAIDASGGAGSHAGSTGGGGGGRVAITYGELGELDIAAQVKAEGGASAASGGQRRGGAGTLWLEPAGGLGRLVVKNPQDALPAAITLLPSLGHGDLAAVDVDNAAVILPVQKVRGDLGGHTLKLRGADGGLLGSWRVARQSGGALQPIDGDSRIRLQLAATPEELVPVAAALAVAPPVSYSAELRLSEIEATGRVQLIADDDLLLGVQDDPAPVINDRGRITTSGAARVALAGEVPQVQLSTSRPEGDLLRQLSSLSVGWTVDDTYGLAKVTQRWTLDGSPTVTTYSAGELTAALASRTLAIPAGTPAGPVIYEVEAENLAGRRTVARRGFTVLANAPPAATVAASPLAVRAGYSVGLQIDATDPEGLASLTWSATGPIKPGGSGQTVALAGTVASRTFLIESLATADGATPIVISVTVTDNLGATSSYGPITVAVAANDLPTGDVSLAAGAPAGFKPGGSTTVTVHAADGDGIAQIELRATGEVTVPVQARSFANAPAVDATFTLTAESDAAGGPLVLRAILKDRFGATTETAPLQLEILADELPTGEVRLPEGDSPSRLPGDTVIFEFEARDAEGLTAVTFVAITSQGATRIAQPVTGTTYSGSRAVEIPRSAPAGLEVSAHLEIEDSFGHTVTTPPAVVIVAADGDEPAVSVAGVAPLYQSGETLSATIASSDNVAVARLEIDFDGATTTVENPPASYIFSREIPLLAAARQTVFLVRAYDFGGNVGAAPAVAVTLTPDPPPSLAISPAAPFTLAPGRPLEIVATASDGQGLASLRMVLGGAVSTAIERGASGLSAVETFRYTPPATLAAGAAIDVVIEARDDFGNVVTRSTRATLLADGQDPSVGLTLSPETAGLVYVSGSTVDLYAIATDNVAIDRLTLSADGATLASALDGAPIVHTWTVPTVLEPTVVELEAEATDPSGNLARFRRQVTVEPLANGGKPRVSFECLSSGAVLPAGYSLPLSLKATDDLGVSRIEIFRDGDSAPFATLAPAGGGTAATLAGASSVLLPSPVGAVADTTLRAVAYDASGNTGEKTVVVHSVAAVDLKPDGGGSNSWSSLAGENVVLRTGTLTVPAGAELRFGRLLVLSGATLTHAAAGAGAPVQGLEIEVEEGLYVACGGAVSATGKGYAGVYPGAGAAGASSGGSHIGVGGNGGASAHGSVYRPAEAGDGGSGYGRGGGVIAIEAGSLLIDGSIQANGATDYRAGGGGSIRLVSGGDAGGQGTVSATGGNQNGGTGSGGGGAVALRYQGGLDAGLRSRLAAGGGAAGAAGGGGTVLIEGPSAVFGDLLVDGTAAANAGISLPALGGGVAQAGSGEGVLASGRAAVAPYFVGHFVEIYGGGTLKGRHRIVAIAGGDLGLEAVSGDASILPGDTWQGVYLVDRLSLRGTTILSSSDPVRALSEVEIAGSATAGQLSTAGDLILRRGASLRHPASTAAAPRRLQLDLAGDLIVEPQAVIDLTGLGYPGGATYPGATVATSSGGGSHMGAGGSASGSTFGSLYRPRENGAGAVSEAAGGGVLELAARNVVLLGSDSAIRANGVSGYRGGGGGSIWLKLGGSVQGLGSIEVNGGTQNGGTGSGGGGALAVEFGGEVAATVGLKARGGTSIGIGGAGTVYLDGPDGVFGDLQVDNGVFSGAPTMLPSFGAGSALAGSGGGLLAARAAAIPPYFVGHWVEIRDGVTDRFEGSFRIAAISGGTATLEAEPGGPAPDVAVGDKFLGVYRFDNYRVAGTVPVQSVDPIRVGAVQEITGNVELREVVAHHLILRAGARLTHPAAGGSGSPGSLAIRLSGDLTLESGASIDVSGRGYGPGIRYPDTGGPAGSGGGSHIGVGGTGGGATFGSLYRPRENGGGGSGDGMGGGAVRIEARNVTVDGTILANGQTAYRGGAGGSVWISARGSFGGAGSIEARGGNQSGGGGTGGGGAVAIEYQSAGGPVLAGLRAWGGGGTDFWGNGGAGTVLLKGAGDTYGHLYLHTGTAIAPTTLLPSLGSGVAQPGSGGGLLVTDKSSIAAYFAGSWVEIYAAGGSFKGTYRVGAVAGGTLALEAASGAPPAIVPGDEWQAVYLFDSLEMRGTARLDSADPVIVAGEAKILGNLTTRKVLAGDLRVAAGGRLGHPAATSPAPETLEIDLTGDLTVESGGTIDLTGLGYRGGERYPGATAAAGGGGGSHLGRGGNGGGSTFGSVYRPREAGGGAVNETSGGGTVAIQARNVVIDGSIVANGATQYRGGAGGSVWIVASGDLGGNGTIEAKGGNQSGGGGTGGGGAVAIEYRQATGSILSKLRAWPGGGTDFWGNGGSGTVYLRSAESSYGDLVIDSGTATYGPATVLPALGGGVAAAGTGGDLLATGLASIPAYFAGHWVEVRGAGGTLRGTWRVLEIAGSQLRLEPSFAGETLTLVPGDTWQGVYRFDNLITRGTVTLESADPIRIAGVQRIDGPTITSRIVSNHLTVGAGGRLSHPPGGQLEIELAGDLTVEAGGAIDVSSLGYGPGARYPGATAPTGAGGGSHLGQGGQNSGSTYGSVYRPREAGGGGAGYGTGGGVLRIVGRHVRIDGAIRANGQSDYRGGAGGSVWITASGTVSGEGSVEAKGGNQTGGTGTGGGGAIALEYASASGGLMSRLQAYGGSNGAPGGAGSVYLRSALATYGDLLLDAGSVAGAATALPPLGGGTAGAGTAGHVLDVGSSPAAYFAGHWVEVKDAAGSLKGLWRVASVAANLAALAPNGGEALSLLPGDRWQGVYLFDNLTSRGSVSLASADPVRVAGRQEIFGKTETSRIAAGDLVVGPAGLLVHPVGGALEIELSGDLTVEAGGAIDVSSLGYGPGARYPGATAPTGAGGGSHLGQGGQNSGSTYGSVYRPREAGGGGSGYGTGGGVLRIAGRHVRIDGAIRANGQTDYRGAAGGSVWITASGTVSGEGSVEAKGGNQTGGTGTGGGGAIALEYASASGGVMSRLQAHGGSNGAPGGVGAVYLRAAGSTYGDLLLDAGAVVGAATVLPSLGGGTAGAGTAGGWLDVGSPAPAYFAGHWVEVKDAAGSLKGLWRVASSSGSLVALAPNGGETPSLVPGDRWQGVYLFDNLTSRGAITLTSGDPVRVGGLAQIFGTITLGKLAAGDLVVKPTGLMLHPAGGSLELELSGDLTVEAGGAIDVSGLGYGPGARYPGATAPTGAGGGSHLGRGGQNSGSTYGSVYRPREAGGGGTGYGTGGGVLRIAGRHVRIEGAIRANGQSDYRGGAGGSVWITASGTVSGEGSVEAKGGNQTGGTGTGGGGAIALEYASASGGLMSRLQAYAGSSGAPGGAGTVFLLAGTGTYGELIVDTGSINGAATAMPGLGSGTALAGTAGATLVVSSATAVPAYFAGHWVEVKDTAGGPVKGLWRIAKVNGLAVELAPNAGETLALDGDDTWRGIYRFDTVRLRGLPVLTWGDPLAAGTPVFQ